jgi:hypothetical protein
LKKKIFHWIPNTQDSYAHERHTSHTFLVLFTQKAEKNQSTCNSFLCSPPDL